MPQASSGETESEREFQALLSKLFRNEPPPSDPPPRSMLDEIYALVSQADAAQRKIDGHFHDFCEKHFEGRRPVLLLVPPTPDYADTTELCGVRVVVSKHVRYVTALFAPEGLKPDFW